MHSSKSHLAMPHVVHFMHRASLLVTCLQHVLLIVLAVILNIIHHMWHDVSNCISSKELTDSNPIMSTIQVLLYTLFIYQQANFPWVSNVICRCLQNHLCHTNSIHIDAYIHSMYDSDIWGLPTMALVWVGQSIWSSFGDWLLSVQCW